MEKKTKRIIGGVLLLICVIQVIVAMLIRDGFIIPGAIWLTMLVLGIVLMLDVKITLP